MQKFVDVSNNNGHVDFVAVKKAGAVGVYLKVTEGTSFVDPDYEANYAAAKAAGLKVGGYHFAHPKNSALTELGFFLKHLKLEKGDLKPALDLEKQEVSWAAVHAFASTFLDKLNTHIKERGVLYCGSWFLKDSGLFARPERKWVPSYGARPAKFDAWQFSNGTPKYPGAVAKLDTSVIPDIHLFVYKAPVHRKVVAHGKKFVVLFGFRVRKGSVIFKWLVKNGRKLRGRA